MYTLARVILISNLPESQWVELNNLPVNTIAFDKFKALQLKLIFSNYRKMYLILTNPFLATNEICVDIETFNSTYSQSTLNIVDMLTAIGDVPLTTITLPTIKTRYAKYADVFALGYNVDPIKMGVSITTPLLPTDYDSLRIYRNSPSTDMELFYNNCLVTVNGFFHRLDFDGTFAYVVNAMKSAFKSRQNQIGMWSFHDVGSLNYVPVTTNMIYTSDVNATLKDKAYIDLSKDHLGNALDLTNKTVMLILGGYLIIPDGKALLQTNSNTFAVDFNQMPYLERLYESMENLDLSSLGLQKSTANPSLIDTTQAYSDSVLTAYLMMSQSFFVIVDSPELFFNKIHLDKSHLPGMYISPFEPKYPMFINNGRVAEYWKVLEEDKWSVTVYQNYLVNRVFSYDSAENLAVISDARVPDRPFTLSPGMFLEVGRDF
jgi:hypothetical protein